MRTVPTHGHTPPIRSPSGSSIPDVSRPAASTPNYSYPNDKQQAEDDFVIPDGRHISPMPMFPTTAAPSAPHRAPSPFSAPGLSEAHGTGSSTLSGMSRRAGPSVTESRTPATGSTESASSKPLDEPELVGAPEVSTANVTQTVQGVESIDPILEDPFQLYRFFVAHNDRPSMHLLITGHHVEKRASEERNTNGSVRVTYNDTKVEDFKIVLDLTSYISPKGSIVALPDQKTGVTPTLRQVMEEHAEDENPFKELHMEKKVVWNYEHLTKSIIHGIRSVHYGYTVEVSFPLSNNRVEVHSASPLATFMRNKWTLFLCSISVVGLAAYPLRQMYKKVKNKSIRAEFEMNITTDEFWAENTWKILNGVQLQ
ncbi:hypothetical protein BGX31_011128 [Mortierella sp. GBA43]|nr:hypothetical protein BGX31_011128 [Mortierella sp. GBA43]